MTIQDLQLNPLQRYIAQVYGDELSLYETLSAVLSKLTECINAVNGTDPAEVQNYIVEQLTTWKNDGTLDDLLAGAYRFKEIGDTALELFDSLYVPNDANLFGRMAAGTTKTDGTNYVNLATLEQNNLIKLGDQGGFGEPTWVVGDTYVSLRSPSSPIYQQTDANENNVGLGRTLRHQGNSSYHFIMMAAGAQTLTHSVQNPLTVLTNVTKQFPAGSVSGLKYTIPRNGMYMNTITMKIKTAPTSKGVLRVSIDRTNSSGALTNSEYADLMYDPAAYGTPFLTCSFPVDYSAGDVIQLRIEPKTEDITIDLGTAWKLYGLGDTIQS